MSPLGASYRPGERKIIDSATRITDFCRHAGVRVLGGDYGLEEIVMQIILITLLAFVALLLSIPGVLD